MDKVGLDQSRRGHLMASAAATAGGVVARDAGKALRSASTVLIAAPRSSFPAPSSTVQKKNADPAPACFLSDFRLFMLKRAAKMKFMPGAAVFPGGALDPADRDERWQRLVTHTASREGVRQGTNNESLVRLSASELSYRIAAIREVFEETGILLVTPTSEGGGALGQLSPSERERWREAVHADASQFFTLCTKTGVAPDVHSLFKWARWITPVIEPKRFDTHFYVTLLSDPSGATAASHDLIESSASAWASPGEALRLWEEGRIVLAPPTWYTLKEVSYFSQLNRLLDYAASSTEVSAEEAAREFRFSERDGRRRVNPILPFFAGFDEASKGFVLALPFDEAHPETQKNARDGTRGQRHRVIMRKSLTPGKGKGQRERDGKEKNQRGHQAAAIPSDPLPASSNAASPTSIISSHGSPNPESPEILPPSVPPPTDFSSSPKVPLLELESSFSRGFDLFNAGGGGDLKKLREETSCRRSAL
uniref:Nudix hydrolase domain-containing protein n=2 Tax=Chromera velia TaxID=505693 RepID=A0A0G4I7Y3_9ALVE|eukprot:Cvel_11717.t1-p1 / transcript=Cvel_11717.t1 / gene=Cvel_11717 / organism=Chromera_velia_CCMP2878 / gene_product=Nucleoside diphosphate-linked moiety X motif 19,, putative / transcript_product=Nucleoside diphosphate-linked moiety X motif 19,, putative / location=Cvel_scaffold743:43157-44593(+) / protein_length=479 / sequence_SO=supercontig / SO=protein_coding / is_pseudo=false